MPYDLTDPRTQLVAAVPRPTGGACRAAQYAELGAQPPSDVSELGTTTWWVRGQRCVLGYSQAVRGECFGRVGHPDEHVVLLPGDASSATVEANGRSVSVQGAALIVVPPGDSRITVETDGVIVRIFSAEAAGLTARCANDGAYAEPDPNVAPYRPWPEPIAGYDVRVYRMADVPTEPGRFGRIFRCTTLMVNVLPLDAGPRDPDKLSPHFHDDFEQISLQLDGDYVHHMRTPWTPKLADWRDDEHAACAGPAIVVIPPPLVHTSQAVGDMRHWLVDVFAPPRLDFSQRPGWVLNAGDYPMPG